MKKPISIFLLVCLLTVQTPFMASPTAGAQNVVLPKPGTIVHLSQPMNPPILKGIKVDPNNPFRFEFILDKGDQWSVVSDQLKEESSRLIKYFLASITTPETDLWVNLSPYEKDRVVPESFGQTEMGRDLLAQDYLLKQVTASLIYPEDELGRKFWKRIYEEAQAKYGTTNIPVNTFNKVWIVPEKAVVYENSMKNEPLHDEGGHTAYVVESRLKVMLEVDYLALEKNIVGAGPRPARSLSPGAGLEPARTDVNQLGSQIVREIIIPALTREVNEGTNFAQLRQVYNSLILATWYKKKIKDSILAKVYADQNKVTGIGIHDDVLDVESIYQQYLTAFKKGVFNYIKDDPTSISTTEAGIPRKYFSGGFTALNLNQAMTTTTNPGLLSDHAMKISVMVQQTHTFPIAQVQRDQAMKAEGYLMERLFNDVFDHPNDFQLHGTRVNQYPWEFTPTAPMIHTARRVLKAIANPYSKLFKIRFIEKEKFSKVEELDWDTLDRSPEEDFYYPEVTKELGPLFQNRLMQLAHDLVENKEPALWGDNRYVGILDMRHAGSANLYDLDLSVDLSEIRKRVEYYLSITPHIANYKKGWKGWADRARTEELVRQYRENVVQVLIQVAIVNIWLERLLEVGERFKLDNDKEERNPGVLLLVEERARGVFGFSNTEVLTREMIKKSYRILLRPIFPDAFRREAEKEAERRGLTDQEEKTAFIGSYIEGKIGPQFRELQEAYELLLHQYPDPVMEANDAAMTTTNPSPLSDQVRKISIEVVQSGKPTKTVATPSVEMESPMNITSFVTL